LTPQHTQTHTVFHTKAKYTQSNKKTIRNNNKKKPTVTQLDPQFDRCMLWQQQQEQQQYRYIHTIITILTTIFRSCCANIDAEYSDNRKQQQRGFRQAAVNLCKLNKQEAHIHTHAHTQKIERKREGGKREEGRADRDRDRQRELIQAARQIDRQFSCQLCVARLTVTRSPCGCNVVH